jgi:hypothetical protein
VSRRDGGGAENRSPRRELALLDRRSLRGLAKESGMDDQTKREIWVVTLGTLAAVPLLQASLS